MTTILIVDDDRDIRDVLSRILAAEGYAVCEAVDGVDALELLTTLENAPHLILLDIVMPKMDGREFLDVLASQREFDALPVIVVSANEDLTLTRAQAVMRKPVALDGLLELIATICDAPMVT